MIVTAFKESCQLIRYHRNKSQQELHGQVLPAERNSALSEKTLFFWLETAWKSHLSQERVLIDFGIISSSIVIQPATWNPEACGVFVLFSVLVVLRTEPRVLYMVSKGCTSLLWLLSITNNMVLILSLAHQIRLRHNRNIYQYINLLKCPTIMLWLFKRYCNKWCTWPYLSDICLPLFTPSGFTRSLFTTPKTPASHISQPQVPAKVTQLSSHINLNLTGNSLECNFIYLTKKAY